MARPTDWLDKGLGTAPRGRGRPMTRDQVIRAAGGRGTLARRIAGLGPGKLPAEGTAARKRYNSAMRSLQRAEKAGQVNPRTGRPYQARPGKRIEEIGKALRRERRLLRRRESHAQERERDDDDQRQSGLFAREVLWRCHAHASRIPPNPEGEERGTKRRGRRPDRRQAGGKPPPCGRARDHERRDQRYRKRGD